MVRPARLSPLCAAALVSAACAPAARYEHGVFRQGPISFHVGALPDGWEPIRAGDGVAFHHVKGGTIFAGVTCDRSQDAPLDVLTNHLLFGVEARQEIAREPLALDGRAALRTRLDGTMDGVPVTLDLVVLKKDGCVYDLHLIAGPAIYAERRSDFERFFGGFARN